MDNEELQAIIDLKKMSQEELDKVDYDLKGWPCQAKKCTNRSKLRDYGISPVYRHGKKWVKLPYWVWLCGKHNKFYRRLVKSFDIGVVQKKLFNPEPNIHRLTDIQITKSKKINK